jgi:hypothetical protein
LSVFTPSRDAARVFAKTAFSFSADIPTKMESEKETKKTKGRKTRQQIAQWYSRYTD